MIKYYWKLNNGEICLYEGSDLVVMTGVPIGRFLVQDRPLSVDQLDKVQLLLASCDSASISEFVKSDQGMRATQKLAQQMLEDFPKST